MQWIPLLAAAFILVPILELSLLLMIAQASGHWWVSLLIVITTGFLGAALARWQGRAVWASFINTIRQGKLPADELVDGAIVIFAAGLLLTPGVLTDGLGLAMLMPWSRGWFRARIKNWFGRRFNLRVDIGTFAGGGFSDGARPDVVDADGRTVDKD
ncbi:MAG: FxsA family protein [Planctomycetales bacterium]|nr:FxsA family protein [Planctomycetales bacterium]